MTVSKGLLVIGLGILTILAPDRDEEALEVKWDELSVEVKEEREAVASEAALEYFRALMRADLETTLEASGVPYALDRKRVVESERELRESFRGAFESKGAQDMEPVSTEVIANRRGIADDCLPVDYVVVRILVEPDGEDGIDLCVRMGGVHAIVGLSD